MSFKEYLEICIETLKLHLDYATSYKGIQYIQGKKDEIDKMRYCLDLIEIWETYQTNKDESLEVEDDESF